MIILSRILSFLMVIISMISFLWNMVGIVPGIILLIMSFVTKEADNKKKYRKWAFICFGGLVLLIVSALLWAILGVIFTVLGVPMSSLNSIPK